MQLKKLFIYLLFFMFSFISYFIILLTVFFLLLFLGGVPFGNGNESNFALNFR